MSKFRVLEGPSFYSNPSCIRRGGGTSSAGEAIDLDGLSTAASAAAPPRATTHGPAAEALLGSRLRKVRRGNGERGEGPSGSGGGGIEATKTKPLGRHVRQPAEELVHAER